MTFLTIVVLSNHTLADRIQKSQLDAAWSILSDSSNGLLNPAESPVPCISKHPILQSCMIGVLKTSQPNIGAKYADLKVAYMQYSTWPKAEKHIDFRYCSTAVGHHV